jgi:tetratricopeptide (TPR) repeat protein
MNEPPILRQAYARIRCTALATALTLAPIARANAADAEPGPPAGADSGPIETRNEAAASEHRQRGEASFRAGEFAAAITEFEAARELSPDPTDLFNLGRIHEEMGELEPALARYREFVKQPRLQLEERRAAAERIEVLRLAVEQDAAQPTPPSQPLAQPRDAPSAGVDEQRVRPLVVAGAALGGVGAALALGGGLGFGLAARRNSDRVHELSAGSNPERLTLAEAEDAHARGRDFEVLQIALVATGAAIAVVGVALLATGLARKKRTAIPGRRALMPLVGPKLVGVAGGWRF